MNETETWGRVTWHDCLNVYNKLVTGQCVYWHWSCKIPRWQVATLAVILSTGSLRVPTQSYLFLGVCACDCCHCCECDSALHVCAIPPFYVFSLYMSAVACNYNYMEMSLILVLAKYLIKNIYILKGVWPLCTRMGMKILWKSKSTECGSPAWHFRRCPSSRSCTMQ